MRSRSNSPRSGRSDAATAVGRTFARSSRGRCSTLQGEVFRIGRVRLHRGCCIGFAGCRAPGPDRAAPSRRNPSRCAVRCCSDLQLRGVGLPAASGMSMLMGRSCVASSAAIALRTRLSAARPRETRGPSMTGSGTTRAASSAPRNWRRRSRTLISTITENSNDCIAGRCSRAIRVPRNIERGSARRRLRAGPSDPRHGKSG